MPAIEVNHNVEMGHRLSQQPDSKCFHIHGHSWRVYLTIYGPMDPTTNMLANLDFADVKGPWRKWLDDNYDHHLLLNPDDDLIAVLTDTFSSHILGQWGITTTDHGDPTVENFARIVYEWSKKEFARGSIPLKFHVKVYEATTNAAEYGDLLPWP